MNRRETTITARALGLALMLCTAAPAGAQDAAVTAQLRDAFRAAAAATNLGEGFQSITAFGANPGISAANFAVDDPSGDTDFSVFRIAPSRTFDRAAGPALYAEGTLGYLSGETVNTLTLVPGAPTRADMDVRTLSFLGGAGVEIAAAPGAVVRPILHAGVSRVTTDTATSGPFAAELLTAARDFLFEAEIDSLHYGGALELELTHGFASGVEAAARLRYTHLFNTVLDASDPLLEGDSNQGALTGGVELDGPLGVTLLGLPLRWIGFSNATWLPGDQDGDLGFSSFVELGGGLRLLDDTVLPGVTGASLRASGIVGEDVTGWSIGLSLDF